MYTKFPEESSTSTVAAALLNMYLMATYGEGKYVETYHNQQIYLNHKLLEQKQLNLTEVQGEVRRIPDAIQWSE